MGFIAVIVIICAVLCQHDTISGVLLILIAVAVLYKKGLIRFIYIYCVIFLSVYLFYAHHSFTRIVTDFNHHDIRELNTTGYFTPKFSVDGNLLMGDIVAQNAQYKFIYKIKSESEQRQFKRGQHVYQRCHINGEFQSPLPNTNISGFHFDEFLYYGAYNGTLTIDNINFHSCCEKTLNLIEYIRLYRFQIGETMMQQLKYGAYITALTTGDTRYIEHEKLNDLKTLGIYHLYAISGSHVALITVQLYYLLKRLYIPIHICKAIILLLLPVYVILTGEAPAVVRAALFMAFLLIKPKSISMLDALCITFIVNLMITPFAIYDIGFQLSYVICFSFIFILQRLTLSVIQLFILTNIISQIATLPMLYYHFNIVYFIGLITNLLFIPLFSLIIFPLCTLTLLFYLLFNHIPTLMNILTTWAFQLHDSCISIFMMFNPLSLVIKSQPLIYYVMMMVALLYIFHSRVSIRFITCSFLLILFLISRTVNEDALHVLDVGQGDAIVIEQQGKVRMIDTGGKVDFNKGWEKRHETRTISEKVILPFLYNRGITQIDELILTHPDLDHIGEVEQLIRLNIVKRIIINKTKMSLPKYASIIQLAKKKNVDIYDESEVRVKGMTFIAARDGQDINDESIVTFVQGKQLNVLLTGDLSKAQESNILSQIKSRIDVVKIGHHGSDTSTSDALLKREFKTALISAGRNNLYGHPHRDTITRLHQYGKQIYNTQSVGRITVKLNREEITTMRNELIKQ
ncbi:DNA internalization-related competence protein ComEC/Rec2 [Macrococcus armenti]|uniref:DNA internalization-related competence protein ComEC/Rec2 n=1 Tax=Macrococcus armenti TaxID=2875764 RepID=UPI001CD03D8B|nr:DNA internalization-related competence protein ComEC/Rec2 [Macrococcus armenti]UBH21480.1 DNA internalization-related competence protein ComEC/Rec2 [Macrococcus armenti]